MKKEKYQCYYKYNKTKNITEVLLYEKYNTKRPHHNPKEQRNGYANRDYQMSLNAVIWLISSNKMNKEDGQTILNFFNKCWKEYKDTTPCLLFIPVKEVGINDGLNINQYYSKEGMQQLLNDVIQGKVNPKKNYNSKTYIAPENLSYVDLSPILNRNKVIESHSNSRREH